MKKELIYDGIKYKSIADLSKASEINYKTLWNAIKRSDDKTTIDEIINKFKNKSSVKRTSIIKHKENENSTRGIVLTGTIDDLINSIDKYDPKSINLIDFENINTSEALNKYINGENFNIFFYNACLYSNNFYKIIRNSPAINFQILTYNTGDQLVDKIIIYYLGILSKFNKKLNIVSRDAGYNAILKNINNKNISIDNIENKEVGFVRMLCSYLLKNRYVIKDKKYYNRADLKSIIENWYNNKDDRYLTDSNLDSIILQLHNFNCLRVVHKKYGDQYLFNIAVINKLAYDDEKD